MRTLTCLRWSGTPGGGGWLQTRTKWSNWYSSFLLVECTWIERMKEQTKLANLVGPSMQVKSQVSEGRSTKDTATEKDRFQLRQSKSTCCQPKFIDRNSEKKCIYTIYGAEKQKEWMKRGNMNVLKWVSEWETDAHLNCNHFFTVVLPQQFFVLNKKRMRKSMCFEM